MDVRILLNLVICCITFSAGEQVKRSTKIVNGVDTDISTVPYLVQIEDTISEENPFCSGSILNEKYILTSSFCLFLTSASRTVVRSGASLRSTGGVVNQVEAFYINPNYNFYKHDNDVGVIQLKTLLKFDENTKPIKLSLSDAMIGVEALVMGWGAIGYEQGSLDQLQSTTVTIKEFEECNTAYLDELAPSVVCASTKGKGSCDNDQGGPLVIEGVQYGIYHDQHGCGLERYPGLYMKVSTFRDLIDEWTNKTASWI